MDKVRIDRIVLNHCRVPARMHFIYGSKESQDFGVVQVFAGGEFHLDDRPGHGGEADEVVIDKYRVARETFE